MLSEQIRCISVDQAVAVKSVMSHHPCLNSSKTSNGAGHLLSAQYLVTCQQDSWLSGRFIVCEAAVKFAAVHPDDACSQLIMLAVFMLVSLVECLALHFCSCVGCLLQDSILQLSR